MSAVRQVAPEALQRARDAFTSRAWAEAYSAFGAAERGAAIDTADLELYATAALLCGHPTESAELWTRAHGQYLAAQNVSRAARCAIKLGVDLINSGEHVRGAGWVDKARRLLDEHPVDCVEKGYLLLPDALRLILQGDAPGARPIFERAAEIGRRFGDADLAVMARHGLGRAMIRCGMVREGCALLDEAMVALEAGDVSPVFAGDIYCSVIEASMEIFDVRRAREWTTALAQWCQSQPDLVPYTGQCLVRRAEIMQLQGDWSAAVDVARSAREHFQRGPETRAIAAAYYQQGELQRLRGEFKEAEESYREAARRGRHPQPGIALMRLAQGQVDSASSGIRAAAEQARVPHARARMLPAYVEIALAANDLEGARTAAEELTRIAAALDAPLLRAAADHACGAAALAGGNAREAIELLRSAWTVWQELEIPYEAARSRTLIGLAHRALGDDDAAELELDAARWLFEQLAATPDVARVNALAPQRRAPGGLTERELQVLRRVAAGDTNRAIASQLRISEKTVARHVANIFTKLGLSSRAAATAYAYEHGLNETYIKPPMPKRGSW